MKYLAIIAALLGVSPALAQQSQPDPAYLNRVLNSLRVQLDNASMLAATQQARADGLQDELNKTQARIKDLESAAKKDAPSNEGSKP